MTQIRQPTQVFNSETYDDNATISQVAFEPASGASNIQVDLNNLRTQVNNILNALNGNWWDNPFAGGGGAGGTNDIPVSGDPATQVSLNTVPIACFADVLTDITVGAGDNYVVLSVAGSEAPTQVGSLSNDVEGVIVAESALSGAPWETNELTERTGGSAISPNNLVTIRDATTLQPIQSGGRDVFALIQVENGFGNGTAFTDVTPQRVKLSFVRINAAGDDLEAVPVADIENQTINYNYPFVQYFKNIDPSCFTGSRSFVDQAASVDVTLQNAYVGGNTITTSVGEGDVTITGDQDFVVSGSVDVDVDTTGVISLDADGDSNFTVDSASLTLNTTTGGDVNVSAASDLNLSGATSANLQSSGGVINVGTNAVATTATIGNVTGTTAVSIVGGTGTHSIATQNAATAGAIVTLDNGGDTIGLFAGSGDPNGTVNAGGNVGSLYAETSGGQLWVNTDGATTWVQFGSAASVTLEQATENTGASPATLGGTSGATTFETQIQDTNTLSWETTASENLLSLFADAGGDVVTIGFGTGDTLDVDSAVVDIDTSQYTMNSTGSALTSSVDVNTVETTGAAADLTLQTTGAASNVTIQTTNTATPGNIALTGATSAGATAGGSVTITSGGSATGAAGNITLIPQAGSTTDGVVQVDSDLDNTTPVIRFDNSGGASGDLVEQFVSQVQPETVIAAPPGSLAYVDIAGTGELWLKTANTTAIGWEQVVTGTVSVTLQDAYDGGNTIVTAAATDIDFSGAVGAGGFSATMGDQVTVQSTGATGTAGPALGAGALSLLGGDLGIFMLTTDTAGTGNIGIATNGTGVSLPAATNSGDVNINTGNTSGGGDSGTIFADTGPAPGGTSGAARMSTGNADTSGNLSLFTGDASVGDSGTVSVSTGAGAAGSGDIDLATGTVTAAGTGPSGSVSISTGNANLATTTPVAGPITVTGGASASTGDVLTAGAITVTGGSNSGTDRGGDINLTGGANTNAGAGGGGLISITGGSQSGTGAAGDVTIAGGDNSGTGTAGDVSVTGGSPTDNNGGSVTLTATDGAGTNRDGGNITLIPGLATGTGTTGVVQIDSAADVDDIMLRFDRSGSQPSISDMYIGQDAPVFTAKAGSLYLQNDQLNTDGGAVWVQRDASGVSATGNDWEELVTSSGALTRTLVQGVANANVTAGNDVSNDAPAANVTMDFGTFPTFPTPQATFNTRVQVWVNGILQRNGVTVTLGTNATDLQFNFQIFSGDIIQIQQWSA